MTKQYQQEVTRVVKEVDLLQAEASAVVMRIDAEAAREKAVTINVAEGQALQSEQAAKGERYAALRSHFNWTASQFLHYVRQKALNAQPSNRVMVGVDAVGKLS